jgi:cytochrome c5
MRITLPVALLLSLASAGCERGREGAPDDAAALARLKTLAVPPEHRGGEDAFVRFCVRCHGQAALGTDLGPPLVHAVYEPGHHADAAFRLAARRGVRQHHWGFGDMPPVPGITPAEVEAAIGYVRWLQRQAGIE